MTRNDSRWMILSALSVWVVLSAAMPAWSQEDEARGGGQTTADSPPPKAEETEADAPEDASAAAEDAPAAEDVGSRPDEQGEGGEEGDKVPPSGGYSKYLMPIIMVGGMVLLFLFMGRRPKQEEKRRKEMLANLKKGDKITSIGGMIGAVMEVRESDVTVKIDETSNTRIKLARWAIRNVGAPDEEKQRK